jgi:phospholipase C
LRKLLFPLGILIAAYGCGRAPSVQNAPQAFIPNLPQYADEARLGHGKIKHIVIIIQENRTVDNLFNGFPGADTVRSGKNTQGGIVALQPISMTARYDLSHKHSAWIEDYDGGTLDGFSTEALNCYHGATCPKPDVAAYGYVPESQVLPYWEMAKLYTFADRMFQTNEGPSFPAHQYLVSGTSTISNGSKYKAMDNPTNPYGHRHLGGCSSNKDTKVPTIDLRGTRGPTVFPCFDRDSIMSVMDSRGISWRYYQAFGGSGEWHAVDALKPIWEGRSYSNVIWPSSRVLKDVADGKLADVTFVTPTALASDHAGKTNGTGPDWVASVVNAVGTSQFWSTTAIFVTWDDWGGWFEHVKPVRYNSYELGFRVPLIVISPYVRPSYVSHAAHEFGSILKFVEKVFELPSLGTTDVRSDDLTDCFDFKQAPRRFVPIKTKFGADYFLRQPLSYDEPDDDF